MSINETGFQRKIRLLTSSLKILKRKVDVRSQWMGRTKKNLAQPASTQAPFSVTVVQVTIQSVAGSRRVGWWPSIPKSPPSLGRTHPATQCRTLRCSYSFKCSFVGKRVYGSGFGHTFHIAIPIKSCTCIMRLYELWNMFIFRYAILKLSRNLF